MSPNANPQQQAWSVVEAERRRDRLLRRTSRIAWTVTFGFALVFTILIGAQVWEMYRANLIGALPFSAVVGMAMPLIVVLGFLSLLIATLCTVGIFLRHRTASLAEIQLRLAALETMLSGGGETRK